jgi:type VI secretion system protein ImpH
VSPAQANHKDFGWKGTASVRDWLYAEPWEFNFFQAVKLLELLSADRVPPGEGSNPDDEVVRLSSRVSLEYPASEVQHIVPDPESGPPTLVANLLGLAGQSGPLPAPDTEMVIERVWHKDPAIRDFLDIFNHRLLSLLVRVRKTHDPAFTSVRPTEGRMAYYLYCFFGMGWPQLRDRLRVDDRCLLHYAGILSQHPRSASGLEQLLSDYFGTRARVVQLVGDWSALAEDQWTRIGVTGSNQVLGRDAILGTRVWDQETRFQVNLGPMPINNFLEFLPIGAAYRPLCELTRYYAGPNFDFRFRLTLRAAEVPGTQLRVDSYLGWTTWLKTRPVANDDSQVHLRAGLRRPEEFAKELIHGDRPEHAAHPA